MMAQNCKPRTLNCPISSFDETVFAGFIKSTVLHQRRRSKSDLAGLNAGDQAIWFNLISWNVKTMTVSLTISGAMWFHLPALTQLWLANVAGPPLCVLWGVSVL